MDFTEFYQGRKDYLRYLYDFTEERRNRELNWSEIIEKADGPENVVCLTVDAVKGFCSEGHMCSPQMKAIVPAIAQTVREASEAGVENLIFTCDHHTHNSAEFASWPPHCLADTSESELEDAIMELPCRPLYKIFPKSTLSSFVDTILLDHLLSLEHINTIVAMGGVTDLCLYHLVAGLRFYAISRVKPWHVIVPLNTCATFDISCEQAKKIGARPHDELLQHTLFLEHMDNLGAEIVGKINK